VNNLSHLSTIELMVGLRFDLSFFNTDTAITFLEVPQCFPKAFLEGTNTYGIFYIIWLLLSLQQGEEGGEQFIMD
jgi:hypothetical protein